MAQDSIMSSLFGISPETFRQSRDEETRKQAIEFAKLDPYQRADEMAFIAGRGLGNIVGGALGAEDPQLLRITAQDQILKSLDLSDPQSINTGIARAQQAGIPELAYRLLGARDQATVRQQNQLTTQRQMMAQRIAMNAYEPAQPAIPAQEDLQETDALRYGRAAVAPSFDISRVEPQLMALGAEGRAELKKFQPEYKVVGDSLYQIPVSGKPTVVSESGTRKTITIGNRVLDQKTMEVLYTAPDATPAVVAEWKAFQAMPKNEQESFLKLQAAKRPSTTFNMPNEGERKAATLANRLNFSVDQINQAIGIDPNAAMPNTSIEIARFLSRSEFIPNKLTSAQRQIVEAAQMDILDAALTLGTGAAYTQAQLEGYRKSYFPQIGDKPENVASKRARLQNILESAKIASGRATVPTQIPSSGADLSSIITAPPSN